MMLHVVTTCRVLNKYFSFLSSFCVVYSLVFLGDANSTQNFLAWKSLNEWKYPAIFLVQDLCQLQNPSSLQEAAIKMDSLHIHFKWVRRLHNNIKQHTRALKMIYILLRLLILITLNILYRKKKHFTLEKYHVRLWTYGVCKVSLFTALYPHFQSSYKVWFVSNLGFSSFFQRKVVLDISKE